MSESEDIFERIRNAPPKFVAVEDELPDAWHSRLPQCIHPLDGYRFRVKLSYGKLFWSYWINGSWRVTQMNPKFIVTHWVKPIWIA